MSRESYVVLRRKSALVAPSASLGESPRAGARGRDDAENLEIVHADLSKAEHADLRRDPNTRAIARPMPMKLIQPRQSEPVPGPTAAPTWGVAAVGATTSPFDGAGITVAVLDTGIDPNHPAFQGVNLVRRNFTTEADDDQHGHGTHCAGTIFGRDVGGQRIGVARGVSRALIGKVLGAGGGSSATIAQAIQWAVNEGAHVVSMSLGIDFPGFVKELIEIQHIDAVPATSIALEAYRANVNLFSELADFVSVQGVFGQGTLIVAASGNESDRPNFEVAVSPPAASRGIVAVAALGQSPSGLSVAFFSNDQVNVAAPGVNVVSAFPGGGLRSMSGTSMATPHVAGVTALWAHKILAETGGVDQRMLLARMVASGTTEPLAAGFEVDDVGAGLVQAPQA